MNSKKITILISSVGTATALSIIKGLKKQKKYSYRIVGTDIYPDAAGRYFTDSFYQIPKPKNENVFIKKLCNIINKERVDIVIPVIDDEFSVWNKIRAMNKFPKILFLLTSLNSLNICQDKSKTTSFFKKINIPTIKTYESLKEISSFPVFIKPKLLGKASINAFRVNDKKELNFYIRLLNDNYVIQEFAEGEEFTIDCLGDLNGRFINGVVRKRSQTKGGVSTKGEIVKDEKAIFYTKKIVDTLKIPGACNIQFFKNKGKYFFFEINPRFAGTHAFTIEAGLNSIYHILSMYNSKTIDPSKIVINYGLKMVRFWDEIFIGDDHIFTRNYLKI